MKILPKSPVLPVKRALALDTALTARLALPETKRGLRLLALFIAHTGDSVVWAILLICAWFFGGTGQWRARVLVTVIGFLAAEIVTVAVKAIVRRPRPPGTFGAFYRRTDPNSFPSGHAARAGLLCIISGILGPLPAFITILVWSPIMVLSRVTIGIHYLSDVLAGILIGSVLTLIEIQAMGFILSLLH
jgi:membrane-associated phospholipid phosphatase